MIIAEFFGEELRNDVRACSKCKVLRPISSFQHFNGVPSGQCRECKTRGMSKLQRDRRLVSPAPPRRKYNDQQRKDRNKEAVARYRTQPRWKALHRLHQFKRRSLIEATDDGTVTDAFLEELYGTENCFYCEEFTAPDKRTLDHKTPLSRQGVHSAANCAMACQPCNSRKRDQTEEEFRRSNDNIR